MITSRNNRPRVSSKYNTIDQHFGFVCALTSWVLFATAAHFFESLGEMKITYVHVLVVPFASKVHVQRVENPCLATNKRPFR